MIARFFLISFVVFRSVPRCRPSLKKVLKLFWISGSFRPKTPLLYVGYSCVQLLPTLANSGSPNQCAKELDSLFQPTRIEIVTPMYYKSEWSVSVVITKPEILGPFFSSLTNDAFSRRQRSAHTLSFLHCSRLPLSILKHRHARRARVIFL